MNAGLLFSPPLNSGCKRHHMISSHMQRLIAEIHNASLNLIERLVVDHSELIVIVWCDEYENVYTIAYSATITSH